MRSSNPPLQVFVEVVRLELIGMCIDKFGSEDFYGFVDNHVCDVPKPGGPLTTRQPTEYS